MNFYSARLLFIILVNDGRPRRRNNHDESIIVFRSRNGKQAFRRAISVGRSMETVYKNKYGQDVRWALVEVESIKLIGRRVDNEEVSSKLHFRIAEKPVSFTRQFKPEKSKPQVIE